MLRERCRRELCPTNLKQKETTMDIQTYTCKGQIYRIDAALLTLTQDAVWEECT